MEKPAAFLKLLSSGRTFGVMFVRKAVFRKALHGTGDVLFCAYCSKIPCVSLLDIGNERCYNKIVIEYGGILPKLQTKHENQPPIRSSRSAAVHGRHLQTANTSKERHLLWAHSPIS